MCVTLKASFHYTKYYDHGVVMHVAFHQGVISYRVVVVPSLPKFQ